MRRIRLGDLLVKAGALDELQLKAALNEQQKWGGQLGKILVDLGFVDEDTMVRALSKQLGLRRARLDEAQIPVELLRMFDPNDARARQYCPERHEPDRKRLHIGMVDPTDVKVVDDLCFRTGLRVEVAIAGESEVSRAIERLFFGRERIEVDIGPISNEVGGVAHGPYYEIEPSQISEETAPRAVPTSERFPAVPTTSRSSERFGPLPSTPPRSTGPVPRSSPSGAYSWGEPSSTSERFGPITEPATAPASWGEPSIATGSLEDGEALDKVRAAQKRQNRAIRAMVDLLIERGVFTEQEFRARLAGASKKS